MRQCAWAVIGAVACLAGCGGQKGDKGDPGENGQPCTVVDNGNGTATMTCPDGTAVTIRTARADAGQYDATVSRRDAGPADSAQSDAAGTDAIPIPGPCEGYDPQVVVEGIYTIDNSVDLRSFAGTQCITGSLIIEAPAITSLAGIESLEKVGGNLTVRWTSTITHVVLPSIVSIGSLIVESNTNMVEFAAPVLATIGTYLDVRPNAALANFVAPALASVGGDFSFAGNPFLPECVVLSLRDQVLAAQGIGGAVSISGNDDPCDPTPCTTGTCAEDCSQTNYYVCN